MTHHWAHVARKDCDPWSEPIGAWHLSWQALVSPEFAEVPLGCHRADICGKSSIVIELQHSPIQRDKIVEREKFYRNMVWIFDATYRFIYLVSGDRVFFSFGHAKHITSCKKPVFLDFGDALVQVDSFTDYLDGISGFGRRRDRPWFAGRFLGGCLREDARLDAAIGRDPRGGDPWLAGRPFRHTKHPTRWMDAATGQTVTYPRATPFIPLNYPWDSSSNKRQPAWMDLICHSPALANGWNKDDLLAMRAFLCATPVIFEGKLRLLPPPAEQIQVRQHVQPVRDLLKSVESHIRSGRIPLLKSETKELLLSRAGQYEAEAAHSFTAPSRPDG
jgi:hypothetical protein